MLGNGPSRRDQHAEDTRRAILAAARQAFARDGYADTSLEAITALARLTKGALYHHFESKAALLKAVYIEMETEMADKVMAAVASSRGGAWDRMLTAVDAFLAASAEPAYVRVVLRDAPPVLGWHKGREIDQAIGLGLVVELVAALRDDGILRPLSITTTARILLAAASEVAIAMAYADDPAATRAEGTAVLVALLDGLRTAPPAPRARRASQRPARRRPSRVAQRR